MKNSHKIIFNFFFFSILIINQCFAQFTFVHISDIHVTDGISTGNYDIDGVKFAQMLTTINNLNPKPVFVIASGDISNIGNCSNSMYHALTKHLFPDSLTYPTPGAYFIDSALTIPIYFAPGNHDYRTGNIPPLSNSILVNYSLEVAPDTEYYITYNNLVILFLRSGYDDNRPISDDSNLMNAEGSGLTDSQCSWVRNVLNYNIDKKKIIVMHHPPVDAIGTNSDGTPFTGAILDTADGSIKYNRTVFLNICDSNNVDIVLAGHVHQNVVANRAGDVVDENWTGGTRYVQTGTCLNGSYRIITVDSISVSVGIPQVSTYNPEYHLSNDNFDVYYDSMQKNLIISCNNFIKQTGIEIGLYNIMGRQILRQHFNYEKQIMISTGNLSKGIFLLSLKYNGGIIIKKVILF